MANPARKIEHSAVFQETGKVIEESGSELTVETSTGTYMAKRAVSCLVEPEPGDLVLTAVAASGVGYVLAVLERPERAPTVITAGGDMEIRLGQGRFTVAAQEGVDLVAGKDVTVIAGDLKVNAVNGSVVTERLSLVGAVVQAEIEELKLLAGNVSSSLTRLYQRVKRSYRVVEELDQVKAEQIDYQAKEHLALHGKHAMITAESLVKVDGDQIHLG